ncbi:hypothetical protein EYF80_067804 [Liparis tanakae]|uniref:Uncharacterized protein n=1 Tax=Liparis tanakae TaxID=230148 RepID=A0A4Z2DZY2_9TELE|nr:hypothetical protein EYF80_067804 [Liparis tanakae]
MRRNGEGLKLRRWDREEVLVVLEVLEVLVLHMYTGGGGGASVPKSNRTETFLNSEFFFNSFMCVERRELLMFYIMTFRGHKVSY